LIQSPRRIGTTNDSNSLKDEKLKVSNLYEYQSPKLEPIASGGTDGFTTLLDYGMIISILHKVTIF